MFNPNEQMKVEVIMWQESPKVKMIGVKVTQEVYRLIEKRVAERGMTDVSQLARFLLGEEDMLASLTTSDLAIIKKRISECESKLAARKARKGKAYG
jgi:hypothetical protein